ncbi:MmpS family protein [Mycobacterium neglectum]|uniref:MmpS family protein n=1 Tax=Mycobacterium neglectum TaxID=242737 RepID=UPI000BFEE9A1|nr:MmpS family protein [Mycobacterium neglectum]
MWIPLVVLAVAGAGAFTVSRLHGMFGSDDRPAYSDTQLEDTTPYNPKHMTYEVFGPPGTVASISYFDANSVPTFIENATLPWSLDFPLTDATAMGSVMAQGDSDSIGCRILVDKEVKTEETKEQFRAFTSCRLTAA